MALTFRKLHQHFAAEVSPIELRRVHDPETLAEIRAGMDEHAVLVFRDQPFSDQEHMDFARRLAQRRKTIWLCYVLVPGLTDDENDIDQIAAFAAGLGNVERVDVLPFHQLGRHKWQKLGLDYKLNETAPPSRELVERVCTQFRTAGLKTY